MIGTAVGCGWFSCAGKYQSLEKYGLLSLDVRFLCEDNMKQKTSVWMINVWILILVMALSGCGTAGDGGTGENRDDTEMTESITFTDALERDVTVTWPAEAAGPERVAALLGSYAQVWTLAGGTVCATADDAWDEFDLELADDVVNLGNTKSLSLEKLLASEPQLILASVNTRQNMEWLDTLEATGIPTAYFEVNSFVDYLNMLKLCTEITGRDDLYEMYGTDVERNICEVKDRMAQWIDLQNVEGKEPPKVLTMRASAAIIKAKNSESTVLGEALKDLGCINIADSDTNILENLSLERILEEDPDHIFFVQHGDNSEGTKAHVEQYFKENQAWLELTAVKEGRVHFMDKQLFSMKPNHRWNETYEILEGILTDE